MHFFLNLFLWTKLSILFATAGPCTQQDDSLATQPSEEKHNSTVDIANKIGGVRKSLLKVRYDTVFFLQ